LARLARIVVPGTPYHVTQRGNRREQIFLGDGISSFTSAGFR
jgi:putative transposase